MPSSLYLMQFTLRTKFSSCNTQLLPTDLSSEIQVHSYNTTTPITIDNSFLYMPIQFSDQTQKLEKTNNIKNPSSNPSFQSSVVTPDVYMNTRCSDENNLNTKNPNRDTVNGSPTPNRPSPYRSSV